MQNLTLKKENKYLFKNQKKSKQNYSYIERRELKRFQLTNLDIPIKILNPDSNKSNFIGKIININEKGILTSFEKGIYAARLIDFKLDLPGNIKQIEGIGRILWDINKNNKTFYGIEFTSFKKENEINKLKQFIKSNNSILKIIDRREYERRKKNKKSNQENRKKERRITKPLFLKCNRFNRVLEGKSKNLYFYFREIQSGPLNTIIRNGKKLLNFASNNYLGLSYHPEVKEAALKAIADYGVGACGSRILSGSMDLHTKLEEKLASFLKGEDCIAFNSGYNANLGIVSALTGENDILIMDAKNHASIIDGYKLTDSKLYLYKHNNIKDLEEKLKNINNDSPKFIITDAVFSMDGDIAELDSIYKLGEKYKVAIMIDDAHGIGVMGKTGHGTAEHFNLHGKIDIIMGTLSKAIGCTGGFVVANKNIIEYIKHNCRPFVFSNSLPPAICAAAYKAIEIIENEPIINYKLRNNIDYLKNELINLNFDIGKTNSAIIPIILKDDTLTYKATGLLEEENIYVNPVAFPAVKKRESRIRISVTATHSEKDLSFLIEKLKKIKNILKI